MLRPVAINSSRRLGAILHARNRSPCKTHSWATNLQIAQLGEGLTSFLPGWLGGPNRLSRIRLQHRHQVARTMKVTQSGKRDCCGLFRQMTPHEEPTDFYETVPNHFYGTVPSPRKGRKSGHRMYCN